MTKRIIDLELRSDRLTNPNCSVDFASLGSLTFLLCTRQRCQVYMRFRWIVTHEISCGLLVLLELLILLEIYHARLLFDLTSLLWTTLFL